MVTGTRERDRFAGSEERFLAIRRVAYVLTGDPHTADGLAQEALLRAAEAGIDLTDPRSHTYLRTVVTNARRRTGRRATKERQAWLQRRPQHAAGPDPTPPRSIGSGEIVNSLPWGARACVVLRYHEDLSINEIADLLEMPPGTVKSHLSRGVGRIRRALGEER
jgi:RNA polymerase sigma factor (sigma-70 family)